MFRASTQTFSRQRAFTLMEVLVVLVILGLISALLMQMLSQSLKLRVRLQDFLQDNRGDVLTEAWVRTSIEAAHPGRNKLTPSFIGNERTLQFLTGQALDDQAGAVHVEWLLERDGARIQLMHKPAADALWRVASWPARAAAFSFLDAQGNWHDAWPPAFGLQGNRLPRAVLLSVEASPQPVTWLMPIAGPLEPPTLVDPAGGA